MMKNRRKRKPIIFLIIIILLIVLFTGCQLAKEESEMNRNAETICGVFVTIGPNSTLIEEYKLKNINQTENNNNEAAISSDLTSLFINEVEGKMSENNDSIEFDGINGYFMGLINTQDEYGEKYSILMADDIFYDTQHHVNVFDEGEEKSSETTFSVGAKFNEVVYMNPVYQRSDGTYYTVIGQEAGIMVIGNNSSGSLYSQTIDNTVTLSENGKTKQDKVAFKVSIATVDEVKQIFIKEMDKNDQLIKTTEYLKSDPEIFVVNSNTDYIIVEEIKNDASGEEYVIRSAYSLEQEKADEKLISHPCNYLKENNMIERKIIQFTR